MSQMIPHPPMILHFYSHLLPPSTFHTLHHSTRPAEVRGVLSLLGQSNQFLAYISKQQQQQQQQLLNHQHASRSYISLIFSSYVLVHLSSQVWSSQAGVKDGSCGGGRVFRLRGCRRKRRLFISFLQSCVLLIREKWEKTHTKS